MKEWFNKTKHNLLNYIKTVFTFIKKYLIIIFNFVRKYLVIVYNFIKKYLVISYNFVKKYLITAYIFIKKYLVISFNFVIKYSVISFKYFKKHYIKIGFYVLAFILFVNAIFMSLHLINRNYDYRVLNKLYIDAILPDQDINNAMKTGIVKIEEINYDEINPGDNVVFCCDYGLDNNWVQEVVAVDRHQKILRTSYDGIVTTNVTEDEAYGLYLKEANFFGTFYYTSSFPRGYVLLMISQMVLLYTYYHVLIKGSLKGTFEKSKKVESVEENENS